MLTFFSRLDTHADRPAIVTTEGTWCFRDIDGASRRAAAVLLAGRGDLDGARVAIIASPGIEFVAALIGIWRAGGVAVPLAVSFPAAELDYVIRDSGATQLITTLAFAHLTAPLSAAAAIRSITTTELFVAKPVSLPDLSPDRPALMLYTSGTTARPKGVVTTHGNLEAQVTSLVAAWEWSAGDRTLLALPLHHVHGLVNVVASALWSGAACEVLPRFDAEAVWARLSSGDISVFTAVPTMYHRLIASWVAAPADARAGRTSGARQVRLMMSGSAALPVVVLERWREITGHTLLERYGMTEIGMALSNPLHGERRPGHVGTALPGVEVRLVGEDGQLVIDGEPGEIEIRGPAVFREYWRRPDETRDAFHDGWFRSGDIAVFEQGAYRILGRSSVDIIKTGGDKVSALEIEDVLRAHPAIVECAVVGVPDAAWGERVCAAVELAPLATLSFPDLHAWLTPRLAPAKIPRVLKCVPSLPRNAMGKVIKPDVAAWFR